MGELSFSDFWLSNWNKTFGSGPSGPPIVVGFPDEARPRHTMLYGGTGAGKSRLIEGIATHDAIRRVTGFSNRGFAILSPHTDLFRGMRDRLSLLALHYPQLRDLVYILDPTNENWSVKWNPLEVRSLAAGESIEARADELARMVAVLYGDDITKNVRQQRVMSKTFLALSLAGRPFPDALSFLVNGDEYREAVISKLRHPGLERYWLREFPHRRDKLELVESTMNRIERFIETHRGIEFIFEGPNTIDFQKILNEGGILLVNGDKGKLKASSPLFLGMVMHALQDAAFSRMDIPEDEIFPFTVHADEFQGYVTDTVRVVVTESRKLKFDVLLATQTPKSLSKDTEIQAIAREVAGNLLVMRQARDAAEEILAREMFTPDLAQVKAFVDKRTVMMSLPEVWEMEIRKLTELPDRMLWWKRRGHPGAHLLQTLTVHDIKELSSHERLPEARYALEMAVYRRTGRPKWKRLPRPSASGSGDDSSEHSGGSPGAWGK